jgi:PPK2 family polyphosphate:nucleotide phosphotransferase
MDTSGKDGTIRAVLADVNPQSCAIRSFKAPTTEELAHDFLWRIHKAEPRSGQIGVFNRSHYEDVLVVRVHNLVPEQEWKTRYDRINDFERILAAGRIRLVKCYLHISKDEQKERLQARLDDPTKRWKFRTGDLEERKYWDDYQRAAVDMWPSATPSTPRGTSCPATANGIAISWSARCCARRLRRWPRSFPRSRRGSTGWSSSKAPSKGR